MSSQPQITITSTLPPGRYCVQLVVTDIHGKRSLATQHILIISAPAHWSRYLAYCCNLLWQKLAMRKPKIVKH
ncbi:MAG: hypothetical protein GW763_12845 [Paraglaciecola sp.]|nr:hypothetical protein [Paraglaciecola sp.]NCT48845.1 hypothetical protein [Paraglaciecola sp.]